MHVVESLDGVGAASDRLDVAACDAEVAELTGVERVKLAHRALVAGVFGDFLCDVHFGSPSFDDPYLEGTGRD